MEDKKKYEPSEPVPDASQLAVLPFLSAVNGLLRKDGNVSGLRLTMHRYVSREEQGFLQQACGYFTEGGLDWEGKVGRTFNVNFGIMGAAFATRKVWHTKTFASLETLRECLRRDITELKDNRNPETVEVSFLAVPFLGPSDEPVAILYADCKELNFFADEVRVGDVVAMCNGFTRLFDWLQENPFLNLRNFPLQRGKPITGIPTVYKSVQESLPQIDPPRFRFVASFNYEAAVA